MKPSTLALVVVIPLAVAYSLSSWMFGAQAEQQLDRQYAQLKSNPYLQLVERKTQRGMFSSEDTATFELKPEFMLQVRQVLSGDVEGKTIQMNEPVRFIIRSNIQHGPIPAFSSVGSAAIHSELELSNPIVTKLYAGQTPLRVDTQIDFSGGGHQQVRSPAIDSVSADNVRISWGELALDIGFNRDLSALTFQGGLPFIKLRSADGAQSLDMSGFKLDGQQSRLFADDPYFYTGPFHMSVASVAIQGIEGTQDILRADKLVATTDVTEAAGFVDITVGYALDKLTLGDMSYSAVNLALAFRHLEAKSLAELNRQSQHLDEQGLDASAGGTLDMQHLKPLLKPAKVILENSPEFAIERLGVLTPKGEVQARALLKLPNANVGNLESVAENPLLLMGLASVIEASAQFSAPEALVQSGLKEEQAAILPRLMQMGYVQRQNGALSIALNYAQGQISINGKHIDPAMMMGAGVAK